MRKMTLVLIACLLLSVGAQAKEKPKLPAETIHPPDQAVATISGAMPTGVTVSDGGRIFINFPRWGDKVASTVAEIADGTLKPFPNADMNIPDTADPENHLLSVQSVVVGPQGRLWILDTGRIEWKPTVKGGAKLLAVDLSTGEVVKKIVFDPTVALPETYLNDVRFDLSRGEEGMAFITDSSPDGKNAIIVVDLAKQKAWRRLNAHPSTLPEPRFLPVVEGEALMNRPANGKATHMTIGVDGIALGPKGQVLYYSVLSGRKLFSVPIDDLVGDLPDAQLGSLVTDLGDKGGASDGLESDSTGAVYMTNYEHNAILRREPDGSIETLVYDPRVLWPDTLCLASDGYLYFTANQLHRQPGFHNGEDLRKPPYLLYRIKVDRKPVRIGRP